MFIAKLAGDEARQLLYVTWFVHNFFIYYLLFWAICLSVLHNWSMKGEHSHLNPRKLLFVVNHFGPYFHLQYQLYFFLKLDAIFFPHSPIFSSKHDTGSFLHPNSCSNTLSLHYYLFLKLVTNTDHYLFLACVRPGFALLLVLLTLLHFITFLPYYTGSEGVINGTNCYA